MSWSEDHGDEEEPGPELQLPTVRSLLIAFAIMATIIFGLSRMRAFGADVKDFGAIGDGITDDRDAIQAAADDCKKKLRAIHHSGGSYMGTCPELYFPAGKYLIRGEIKLNGYQTIRGEDSILIQDLPTSRTLVFEGCYRNTVSKLQFQGGTRQVAFSNANVDMTRITVRDCVFQAWTEYAIAAEGTGPDLHMSATLSIDHSVFDGASMLLTRCDSTTLRSCRHQFRGPKSGGVASIVNRYAGGVLHLDDFTATPVMPTDATGEVVRGRWVDNHGSVFAHGCRFGGEGAGIPVFVDHGGPNLVNPWQGRSIVIEACQVSPGRNVWPESALITLNGLPQCVRVTSCRGIVSATIPLIKVADGYDLEAAVRAVEKTAKGSLPMYSIEFRGNQFFAPVAIPAPLQRFVIK